MQIKDKVIVITGGGSGIGADAAIHLAEDGAKIAIAGRTKEKLDKVVGQINDAGGQAIGVPTDITDEDEVANLMDTAIAEFGKLDVVLANAGAISDSLMINTDKETGKVKRVMSTKQFKSVVDINMLGSFLTLREGARRMVDNGWKGLLLITSSINSTGQLGQLNYSSTKVAETLWPKILAGEFHSKGIDIRVVGIAPGYTATEILRGMDESVLNVILKDVHIGRLIEPAELTETIKHVMLNEAIDGTTIEVTGGLTFGPRTRVK